MKEMEKQTGIYAAISTSFETITALGGEINSGAVRDVYKELVKKNPGLRIEDVEKVARESYGLKG